MMSSYHFFVICLYPTGIPEPLVFRQTGDLQKPAPIILFLVTFIATFDEERHGNCNLRAITSSKSLHRRWHDGFYQRKNDGMEGGGAGGGGEEGEGIHCQNPPN